jgi:WD40 repeat protein
MLVVVTGGGTVSVLDESKSGPDGVGLRERRKFRVKINDGRRTIARSKDGDVTHFHVGEPQWHSFHVDRPIAVVSVNGTVVAVKDSQCGFSTWDIATGLFIRRFVGHDDSSAPSEEKISCKCMPWLHAWPESECPAPGHRSEITAMAISHLGDRIASADVDGVILVWDAGTAAVLHKHQYEYFEPMAIAFSPAGHFFVVTDTDGFVVEYETASGHDYGHEKPFHPCGNSWYHCEIRAAMWTPDSNQFICGYEGGQVRQAVSHGFEDYNSTEDATMENVLDLGCSVDAVNAIAISPDGKSVAVAGQRIIGDLANGGRVCGFVAVYNSSDNMLRWKDFATPGCDGGVTSLSFSLDGKQLASAGEDKYVRLWDPRDGSRLKACQQYDLPTPRRYTPEPELSAPIVLPARIVCTSFCADPEETPEKRRLAFAQGHHKRLGAGSILQSLPPDLLNAIAWMGTTS